MPNNVQVAAENEEVWFPHPAGVANLYFQVRVIDGVLHVVGFDCAYGPSEVEVQRGSVNAVLILMPKPPSQIRAKQRHSDDLKRAAAPELYQALQWALSEIDKHEREYQHRTDKTAIALTESLLAKARGEQTEQGDTHAG
jgi:hypothetical protein